MIHARRRLVGNAHLTEGRLLEGQRYDDVLDHAVLQYWLLAVDFLQGQSAVVSSNAPMNRGSSAPRLDFSRDSFTASAGSRSSTSPESCEPFDFENGIEACPLSGKPDIEPASPNEAKASK
jgi:hypothetical protein